MPEGDTIFRAARTLDRALSGERIESFRTVLPQLARIDDDTPLTGRTIESVTASGKHLLIHISGDLTLRTHLRMHGSWHIYRRGERWRVPAFRMRIAIATTNWEAVGFNIPIAEFIPSSELPLSVPLSRLGPDLLSDSWDEGEAARRIRASAGFSMDDVLLDQSVVAGIGNVFKSEILFLTGVHPARTADTLTDSELESILRTSRRLLRANVTDPRESNATWTGARRTTGRSQPSERLWVYGRGGRPCRRCGTPIERALSGRVAPRPTYWCPRCQPPG